MLTELEAVFVVNDAILSFIVFLVSSLKLAKDLHLNVSVVNIELFVFAYFRCDNFLLWVFKVYTLYHLTEGSRVDNTHDFVSPCKLLTWLDEVEAFSICYCILVLSSYFSYSINSFIHAHLYFFKFCEFLSKYIDCFMRGVAIPTLWGAVWSHCALRARCFCLRGMPTRSKLLWRNLELAALFMSIVSKRKTCSTTTTKFSGKPRWWALLLLWACFIWSSWHASYLKHRFALALGRWHHFSCQYVDKLIAQVGHNPCYGSCCILLLSRSFVKSRTSCHDRRSCGWFIFVIVAIVICALRLGQLQVRMALAHGVLGVFSRLEALLLQAASCRELVLSYSALFVEI